MKTLNYLTLISFVCWSNCNGNPPIVVENRPFQSVIAKGDKIVATLPANSIWMVEVGTAEARKTKPSESFSLEGGSTLNFFERHSSYSLAVQTKPILGLKIDYTFDARSFGRKITKKSYFVPAR